MKQPPEVSGQLPGRNSLFLAALCFLALVGCQEIAGKIQAPVQVRLSPFLLLSGYYVDISNLSESPLEEVTVTYLWQGNSYTQKVGTIPARTTTTIAPSTDNIQVAKDEQIRIGARGYLPKTIDTNTLIGN